MSIEFGRVDVEPLRLGRRMFIALAVLIANVAAVLSCYAFDILGIFRDEEGFSCSTLITGAVCISLNGDHVPHSLLFTAIVIAVAILLGLYDPRPLISRIERTPRSNWWLIVSAVGSVILVSPYLAAASVPYLLLPEASYLPIMGAAIVAVGLLLWLSDMKLLRGTVLVAMAIFPATALPHVWMAALT